MDGYRVLTGSISSISGATHLASQTVQIWADGQRRADVARDREECKNLRTFVQRAWHVLEPEAPYVHGWHMDAIADHLEAVTNGKITRLLVALLAQPNNWGLGEIVLRKVRGMDDFQIREIKKKGTPADYFGIMRDMTPEEKKAPKARGKK